jgi:anti-sigma regulatory factor (Ser/Thr protein kinase)
VQSTAVGLAGEQALIRRNMGEVFVNLGRRNQGLLGRTLSLITKLEKEEKDPDTLDNLFRLDHLTTRMRRNAESLLVLAGTGHARTARRDLDMSDVIRASQSEIEHYTRVDSTRLAPAKLQASAVADLTHLIAELLENATNFSDGEDSVVVQGRPSNGGYILTIEDRGVGMSEQSLMEANRRLANSSDIDSSTGKTLGLFVVGRLAARHGVKVRLLESPAEGLTAKIRIPSSLLAIEVPAIDDDELSNEVASTVAASQKLSRVKAVPRAKKVAPADEWLDIDTTFDDLDQPVEPEAVEPEPVRYQRRVRGANLFESGDAQPAATPKARRNSKSDHDRLSGFQSGVRRATTDVNEMD